MTSLLKASAFATALLQLALLIWLLSSNGSSQTQGMSSSDLIRSLVHRSERTENSRRLVFSCGETEEDREDLAAAKSLVKIGAPAVPDLERTLDAIEGEGEPSEFTANAGLILAAYAEIKGADAYPRLRSMVDNPKLAFIESALDSAIALSLGLTSYVSYRPSTLIPDGPSGSCGVLEPRHDLDQLIIAWAAGSASLFRSSLGPDATTALNALLNGRDWAEVRAEFWHSRPGAGLAVGYRLDVSGRWAEPTMGFAEKRENAALTNSARPEIDTFFRTGAGGDCGTYRIKFLREPVQAGFPLPAEYVVDNTDLAGLLRLIADCASPAK